MKIKSLLLSLSLLTIGKLYSQPGTLDSSFGVNGKVVTDIGFYDFDWKKDPIAIQPDGKIVVVSGIQTKEEESHFIVLRYNIDGSPDLSFGTNGSVETVFETGQFIGSQPSKVLIQPDGKIIAGGYGNHPIAGPDYFALSRYLPDGKPDSTFGINGKSYNFIGPYPKENELIVMALLKDGKIITGGYSDGFCLVKYKSNGFIDSAFGNNGIFRDQELDWHAITGLSIREDRKIVTASAIGYNFFNASNFVINRVLPDGLFDSTFGNNGFVYTDFYGGNDIPYDILQLKDESIVAAGYADIPGENGSYIALAKYKNNGSLDSSFGISGKITTKLGETSAVATKILQQKDGKFILSALVSSGKFVVARFNANGSIDSSYGINGKGIADFGTFASPSSVAFQSDGKIVAVGAPNVSLARFKGYTPPIATISTSGPTTFCQGDSVLLSADADYGPYLWSTGDTTQSITVKQPGTYNVRVTFINRDTATTAPVTVTVNPNPSKPTITANGNIINVCPGKTVTLTSSSATSYVWNTGATTQSIIVNTAGNYTVTVINANGCSNKSDTAKVTYRLCAKPAGLARNNITATAAKLSWTAVPCAVGYQYEWRKKGTALWSAAQTNLVNRTITGLTPNTTYQWRVITACKISPDTITSAGYTNGAEFTTLAGFAANINSNDETKTGGAFQAKLYPNPTKDIASVSTRNAKGKVQITLSDISGKQLWQSAKLSSTNISIPIQNLATGAYTLIVRDEKETKVLKLLKE